MKWYPNVNQKGAKEIIDTLFVCIFSIIGWEFGKLIVRVVCFLLEQWLILNS